jgi:hypothetical protein
MALDGYEPGDIAGAMAEASPGLADRHDVDDYVRRTVAAVERLPEVQQVRREMEQEHGPSLGR